MTVKQREADYFRIGIFVLLGIVLIIVAFLAFSSGGLFKKHILIETYFNESVQGLTVGSEVKYRGIDIGRVKEIKLVSSVYPLKPESPTAAATPYERYVYVLLSINPDFITETSLNEMPKMIERQVKAGLRVKMSLQSLTGTAYLELNFAKPQNNPVLPITWKPEHIYIPSTTSTLTRVTDSVQAILNGLQGVDFKKVFANIQSLAGKASQLAARTDNILQRTSGDISQTINNTKIISSNLSAMSDRLRSNPSDLIFSKPAVVDPKKL